MATRALTDFRVAPVLPLANSIRTMRGGAELKTAEALDHIGRGQNSIADAIRALAARVAALETGGSTPVTGDLLIVPDILVITTGAQTIQNASTTPPIVYADGKVLVLRIQQAPTPGGGLIAWDSADFWPTPQEISQDPDTITTYLFAGIGGRWFFLSVANPL